MLEQMTPADGTLNHFIGHVGADPFAVLRHKMVRRLIRMKALDGCRLRGRFVLAADGTGHLCFRKRHCEHCLEQKHGEKTIYMHQVLEAKLVSPSGLALSVGSEFIENPSEFQDATGASEEQRKQDCELKALSRLAPVLKRDFPQARICLTADNLFACGRAIQIAHIILQLLEMGSLLQRLARTHGKTALELFGSLKRIARRLLECFRYYRLPDEAYADGTAIRIRLDTC